MEPTTTKPHTFLVDGMHCANCLRKIRSEFVSDSTLTDLRIDIGRRTLRVTPLEGFKPEFFKERVHKLGFEIKEAQNDTELETRIRAENKRFLYRLGVTAASTGNLMLVSFALYSGAAETEWAHSLEWLSFALFLPVLLYGAYPFFVSSYQSLKAKRPSIDLPLSIAILGGSILSTYHLVEQNGQIYFDSLSMIVLLILSTRYLVFKVHQNYLAPMSITDVFNQKQYVVLKGDSKSQVDRDNIQIDDRILLSKNDTLPVDARLVSTHAEIDNSALTGESLPQTIERGERIYAGARVLSSSIETKALSTCKTSRLNFLIESVNKGLQSRSKWVALSDRAASYFSVSIVIASIAVILTFWTQDLTEGFNRALALLVVACPCALGIVTPLALSLSFRRALNLGLLVKDHDFFEKLQSCHYAVFDKTGTLTSAQNFDVHWLPRPPSFVEASVIFALESKSDHPIATAIRRNCSKMYGVFEELPEVEDFQELPSVGVEGVVNGKNYSVRKSYIEGVQKITFSENTNPVLTATIHAEIPDNYQNICHQLREAGLQVMLLSGDSQAETQRTAKLLGIKENFAIAECTPESKAEFIQDLSRSSKGVLFVGDGHNDTLAMSRATVAISVFAGMETAFKASQAYFLKPGLTSLLPALNYTNTLVRVLKRNLAASFIYNLTFGTFALLGFITPLVAAILMPVSSLSLILHTVFSLNWSKK
ncbi:MAG: hypothetical protein COT74_13900 [Bdellovibrionales bacterium CG10_big_fil_rev_8_21_14_0_10_45_34]|nr:MAG: hypothetical protein COT74_13900 [Bdellovibrionales bacterium CG10_big_fil_rev_8_21_14_0_10_45_34]